MTFTYIDYMFSTYAKCFSFFVSSICRGSSSLIKMHLISQTTLMHVLSYDFVYIRSLPVMTLRLVRDNEVICAHPKLTSYMFQGSGVSVLHDMRMVCLCKMVALAGVTNTSSFSLVIDYIHYAGSFEELQTNVKCLLSVGPARPVRVP